LTPLAVGILHTNSREEILCQVTAKTKLVVTIISSSLSVNATFILAVIDLPSTAIFTGTIGAQF
jgi:hypothetical protein